MSRNLRQRTTGGSLTYTLVQQGGSSLPAGNNNELQYNASGSFGGIPSLTYDGTYVSYTTVPVLGNHLVRKSDLESVSAGLSLSGTTDLNVRDITCRDITATGTRLTTDYIEVTGDLAVQGSINGTIGTGVQPYITTVGQLEDLTVVGSITCQTPPSQSEHVIRKTELDDALDTKQDVITSQTDLTTGNIDATNITQNGEPVVLQSSLGNYQPLLQSGDDIEVKDIICQNVSAGNSLTINEEQVATHQYVSSQLEAKQDVIDENTELRTNDITTSTLNVLGDTIVYGTIYGTLTVGNQTGITKVGILEGLDVDGYVTTPNAPTSGSHLTNKSYVDQQIATRQANITSSTNLSLGNVTSNGIIQITNGSSTLSITPTSITSSGTLSLGTQSTNASTATISTNTSSTTQYPVFVSGTTGSLGLNVNSSLSFVPSTGIMNVTRVDCTNLNCSSFITYRTTCCRVIKTGPWFSNNSSVGSIPVNIMSISGVSQFNIVDSSVISNGGFQSDTGHYRIPRTGVYEMSLSWRITDGTTTVGVRPFLSRNLITTYIEASGVDGTFWTPNDGSNRRCGYYSVLFLFVVNDLVGFQSSSSTAEFRFARFSIKLVSLT
jgi:hypothetical protein